MQQLRLFGGGSGKDADSTWVSLPQISSARSHWQSACAVRVSNRLSALPSGSFKTMRLPRRTVTASLDWLPRDLDIFGRKLTTRLIVQDNPCPASSLPRSQRYGFCASKWP